MKKYIARIMTAVMLLGLLNLSALATDTYGAYTLTDARGTSYSFTAAKMERSEITIDYWGEEQVTQEVTMITVQPGSILNVKDKDGQDYAMFIAYNKGENGYTPLDGTVLDFESGVVDILFGNQSGWSVPVDALNIQVTEAGEEAFVVLGGGTASAGTPAAGSFSDVASGSYYYDAVKWAVEQGVTTGTSATTFAPQVTCTTAQILTFLWRASDSPEPAAANPFSDISESDYYYKAALWAAEQGLVSGDAFDGATPCTRSATVTYLWKLEDAPATDAANFTDVDEGAEYAQAVAWALKEGITTGATDTTFAPDVTCTRGQIVTFLYRWAND